MASRGKAKLRAVFGEWEDGEVVFLGAVEAGAYEAILEDDECEGTRCWRDRVQQWVDAGPCGVGEIREAWIEMHVAPGLLFDAPSFPAFAIPANQGDHDE